MSRSAALWVNTHQLSIQHHPVLHVDFMIMNFNALHATDGGMWILKPSRFDRGDDKYVVKTGEHAEKVLWRGRHLSDWVCQKYIERPMLVHGRKFHIRCFAMAVGALKVYMHDFCLVATAALPFTTDDIHNIHVHVCVDVFIHECAVEKLLHEY